ncbi:MAG: hypothetical protein J6V06_09505 [Clostridia bacterium]|nr:hypothetical protein [Clostridia bacterium]
MKDTTMYDTNFAATFYCNAKRMSVASEHLYGFKSGQYLLGNTTLYNTNSESATEKVERCIVSNRGYVGNILIITLFDTISLPSNEKSSKKRV